MISPDKLIPPDGELAHFFLQTSEQFDVGVWKIANITNELIDELDGVVVEEERITKKDIYNAIAVRCKGKAINTIRRWAECARDFDFDLQDKYSQLLSFEHFKQSRRLFEEGYTPSIEYGLDWCVSGDDFKVTAGRFHTVGEMLNHFIPEFRDDTAQAYWKGVREKLYDKIIIIDNDTDRNDALKAWKTLDWVLDKKQNL